MNNLKEYWDNVYSQSNKHSWNQESPNTTLSILDSLNLNKEVNIIDVGGGDSSLVDHLINLGYKNITVLDISEEAINISKKRLGENSKNVKWIVSDITEFKTDTKYDVWIDRATFHFLKDEKSISYYFNLLNSYLSVNGYFLLATFSDKGPNKCSGLNVNQYTKEKLTNLFESNFNREKCVFEDHITPSQLTQNFIYVLFKKRDFSLLPSHSNLPDQYSKPLSINAHSSEEKCDVNSKKCCC